MAIVDDNGLPVAIDVTNASPHESKLVESTLASRFSIYCPKKMIGDKAYDSDPLDKILMKKYRLELIAPHKRNRKSPSTQDGRKLRGYRDRWKVERFFAWLDSFKRTVTRFEKKSKNFLGMVKLASIVILLRRL